MVAARVALAASVVFYIAGLVPVITIITPRISIYASQFVHITYHGVVNGSIVAGPGARCLAGCRSDCHFGLRSVVRKQERSRALVGPAQGRLGSSQGERQGEEQAHRGL